MHIYMYDTFVRQRPEQNFKKVKIVGLKGLHILIAIIKKEISWR